MKIIMIERLFLKGDSDNLKDSLLQIQALTRLAPDIDYPSETRGAGGQLRPQTLRLRKAFGENLLTFSLYDYRGGGLTDFSEGTDDADFSKIMVDLYDSETILIVLDSLIMKHHTLKRWRAITAESFINRVLVELQLMYPNRKYDIVIAFTKFEASILYTDVFSASDVQKKQTSLLNDLMTEAKKVFQVFEMPNVRRNWSVSYIPVDVVGLGCEETTSQDFTYRVGGSSFSGFRFGSKISDERDVEPFNLDFLALHLFASMLRNRGDRILEEISFLNQCYASAKNLESANNTQAATRDRLNKLTSVSNGSWWRRFGYWMENAEFVSTTLGRTQGQISNNDSAIAASRQTLASNKTMKLPDERDHILLLNDASWNTATSSTIWEMISELQKMHQNIWNSYNEVLRVLPYGKIAH